MHPMCETCRRAVVDIAMTKFVNYFKGEIDFDLCGKISPSLKRITICHGYQLLAEFTFDDLGIELSNDGHVILPNEEGKKGIVCS